MNYIRHFFCLVKKTLNVLKTAVLQWGKRLIDINILKSHYQRLSGHSSVLIRYTVLWVTLSRLILCYCCQQHHVLIAVTSACESPDYVKSGDQLLYFNDSVSMKGTLLVLNITFRISCWPCLALIALLVTHSKMDFSFFSALWTGSFHGSTRNGESLLFFSRQ